MVPYTKDADTAKSSTLPLLPHQPPAAGAPQKGEDAKVGGRKEQVQQGTCLPADNNQLKKGRAGCGLGLDPVSAAARPYLTRQLATASPRERVTPLKPGKFYVPLGTKVPEPTSSGNLKCHDQRWMFKMYVTERVCVFCFDLGELV